MLCLSIACKDIYLHIASKKACLSISCHLLLEQLDCSERNTARALIIPFLIFAVVCMHNGGLFYWEGHSQ